MRKRVFFGIFMLVILTLAEGTIAAEFEADMTMDGIGQNGG